MNLLSQTKKDSIVCDDLNVLSYKDVIQEVSDLDIYFKNHEVNNCQCLHVSVANSIDYVIVLWYLLTKRINFFLYSGFTLSKKHIPRFCDKILSIQGDRRQTALTLRIKLHDHVDFVRQPSMLPGSGMVLFSSSGTTGTPKYIWYTVEKLFRNVQGVISRFRIQANSKLLVPVPINHSYGFKTGLLPALLTGSSLCLIEKNNVVKLIQALNTFNPDIALLTPSVCKMLVLANKRIPKKCLYITAGDRMQQESYLQFESKFGKLLNLYGCTELGAIAVTSDKADLDERIEGIMKPLKDIKVKIKGARGEVQCKVESHFECYINTFGQRIEKPVDDLGFGHNTNDLALKISNGKFKLLGRTNNCVNRLGFLVSLQEIEFAIENVVPGAKDVIVVRGNKENLLGIELVAFYEAVDPKSVDVQIVKSICKEKIARHLVPDHFYFIDRLPRLPNGKPDRVALSRRVEQRVDVLAL